MPWLLSCYKTWQGIWTYVLDPMLPQRGRFTGLREWSRHSKRSSQEQVPLARTTRATYAGCSLSCCCFHEASKEMLQARRLVLVCKPATSCCFSLLVLFVRRGISRPSRKIFWVSCRLSLGIHFFMQYQHIVHFCLFCVIYNCIQVLHMLDYWKGKVLLRGGKKENRDHIWSRFTAVSGGI